MHQGCLEVQGKSSAQVRLLADILTKALGPWRSHVKADMWPTTKPITGCFCEMLLCHNALAAVVPVLSTPNSKFSLLRSMQANPAGCWDLQRRRLLLAYMRQGWHKAPDSMASVATHTEQPCCWSGELLRCRTAVLVQCASTTC